MRSSKLECTKCNNTTFKTLDARKRKGGYTRRRKQCTQCGEIIATYEFVCTEEVLEYVEWLKAGNDPVIIPESERKAKSKSSSKKKKKSTSKPKKVATKPKKIETKPKNSYIDKDDIPLDVHEFAKMLAEMGE